MNVFLAFCQKDVSLAHNLLLWISELKPQQHHITLVADSDTDFNQCLDALNLAKKAFSTATLITSHKPVVGWIPGSNALWMRAAEHAHVSQMPYWLFLEPDAVPVKPDWLNQIEDEYRSCGKQYMGAVVYHQTPSLPNPYLEGVAVYPWFAWAALGRLVNDKQSWTLTTTPEVMDTAGDSVLFQHLWGERNKSPSFSVNPNPSNGVFGLSYIKPKTVLFHRNKDGTLINLLRKKHNIRSGFPRCYIQLGRNGDLLIVLRALKIVHDLTRINPALIVSYEYSELLEGVSYVDPIPIREQWWFGIPNARELAKKKFGDGTVLQCHGKDWGVDMARWRCFQESMWERTMVPLNMMKNAPLVFDRRNPTRESLLCAKHLGDKPVVLYNFTGKSSPFPHTVEVMRLFVGLRDKFRFVDLGKIVAHRLYDLLGLYDKAAGLITIDTSTLHLAAGSNIPYIALTVNGWGKSVPCGNCVLEVPYNETISRLGEILKALENFSSILKV